MRKQLVGILVDKGIKDQKVLAAIGKVPRHYFLDSSFVEQAYQDKAFPIGEGQTISQPYTVAKQTELLQLKPKDKVLEIGTGSGYQTSILMEMGVQVFSIELIRNLHEKAKIMLSKMKYQPKLFCGDGTKGLPSYAPFDKIIVTAGAPVLPEVLLKQLNINGILVIPVGDDKTQKMLKITKISETEFEKEDIGNFSFVKLKGENGW